MIAKQLRIGNQRVLRQIGFSDGHNDYYLGKTSYKSKVLEDTFKLIDDTQVIELMGFENVIQIENVFEFNNSGDIEIVTNFETRKKDSYEEKCKELGINPYPEQEEVEENVFNEEMARLDAIEYLLSLELEELFDLNIPSNMKPVDYIVLVEKKKFEEAKNNKDNDIMPF